MSIEAMKQALEALELTSRNYREQRHAVSVLRQAIEQAQKREPVGEMIESAIYEGLIVPCVEGDYPVGTKLYASPPPRQRLRGEQVYAICRHTLPKTVAGLSFVPEWAVPLARAIEDAVNEQPPRQPEQAQKQEPYGYLKLNTGRFVNEVEGLNPMTDKRYLPLYTSPPPRQWVGLTDEEIHKLDPLPHVMFDQQRIDFARAIETLLKEKNT